MSKDTHIPSFRFLEQFLLIDSDIVRLRGLIAADIRRYSYHLELSSNSNDLEIA